MLSSTNWNLTYSTLDELFELGDVKVTRLAYDWVEIAVWVEEAHGTVSVIARSLDAAIERASNRVDLLIGGTDVGSFDVYDYLRHQYEVDGEEYDKHCDEMFLRRSESNRDAEVRAASLAAAEANREELLTDTLDAMARDADPPIWSASPLEPPFADEGKLTDADIDQLLGLAGAGYVPPTPTMNPSIAAVSEPFSVVEKPDGTKTTLYALVIAVPSA